MAAPQVVVVGGIWPCWSAGGSCDGGRWPGPGPGSTAPAGRRPGPGPGSTAPAARPGNVHSLSEPAVACRSRRLKHGSSDRLNGHGHQDGISCAVLGRPSKLTSRCQSTEGGSVQVEITKFLSEVSSRKVGNKQSHQANINKGQPRCRSGESMVESDARVDRENELC